MSLHVLEAGLYPLVVDLGRPRLRSFGVPLGGAADRWSLAMGNALVGNPPEAAALEVCLAGPTLRADGPVACVVFGAPFDVHKNGLPIAPGKTFNLDAGDVLSLGTTRKGLRAYLCVMGGIQTPPILESRSGFEPIRSHTDLPCSPGRIIGRFMVPASEARKEQEQRLLPPEARTFPWDQDQDPFPLRVLPGPQGDWFREEEFYQQEMMVSPASNRMGLRIQGRPLTMPDRELVSEPVCPGTVQVTRDGQCIILGVDGQTIGGYPRIAQVISADLDYLGQLGPGRRVRFVKVDQVQAGKARRLRRIALENWIMRLETVLVAFS